MHPDPSDAPHPTPDTPDAPRRHAYPDATWALARRDYLDGDPAELVCDRYGMSVSTFRDRARREKWRLCDQPEPDPVPDPALDHDPEADEPVDCAALAGDALVRVRRALRRGRAAEAASWMRLHDKLTARIEALEERARRRAQVAAARGGDLAAGALAPLRERLNLITRAADNEIRLSAAVNSRAILESDYYRLSGLNDGLVADLKAAVEVQRATAAAASEPGPDLPSDPHCTHPLFSVSDDP